MSIISILELAGVAHLPRSRQMIESVILIEGYKEAQVEFGSVAGEEQAKTSIDQFRDLVNRNQVQGNERNIDYWRKQGWDQFSAFVQEKSQEKSKTQIKRSKSEGQSIVLLENPHWLVVVPLDKDASCFHGRNTDWCTTKPMDDFFEQYFYDREITLIYFLKLDSGTKWAIAAHSKTDKMEMFDQRDNPITAKAFQRQTGFDPMEFRNRAVESDDVLTKTAESRATYKRVLAKVVAMEPFTEVNRQLERDLLWLKKAWLILNYCKHVKGRWPEAEPILVKSYVITSYVFHVLNNKRISDIERMIRSGEVAMHYAINVINGRWPERESLMIRDVDTPLLYHSYYSKFMKGEPWPEMQIELINRIKGKKGKVPRLLNVAIKMVIDTNVKWPELETVLVDYPKYMTEYTKIFGN